MVSSYILLLLQYVLDVLLTLVIGKVAVYILCAHCDSDADDV